MIDLTGVNLVLLVQQAYVLSQPRGLGFLHHVAGDVLSDHDAAALIAESGSRSIAVNLDYVKGRGCKLVVFRRGDRLEMNDAWYDHTAEQLAALLKVVKPEAVVPDAPHGVSCECNTCNLMRQTEEGVGR